MTMPLFYSASTKAVQRAVQAAYPGELISFDEKTIDGHREVHVTAIDYHLSASETASWCVDLYSLATGVSSLPVSVVVNGEEGNWSTKDRLTEENESRLGGVTLVCAGQSAYSGGASEWARVVVIEYPDATPEQKRRDQRAMAAIERGPAGMVAFDLLNPVNEVSAVPEQPSGGEPRETVSFAVLFWTDDEASITWSSDESIPTPLGTEDVVEYIVEVLPHYFAKIMANLGDSPPAHMLAQQMAQWAELVLFATDGEDPGTPVGGEPLFSAGGVTVVEPRETEPRVVYSGRLLKKGGGGCSFAVLTENEPDGGEAFYAPVSVLLLANTMSVGRMPVRVVRTIARSVSLMCAEYEGGPRNWDSLASLETVPRDALLSARASEGTETATGA